MPGLFTRSCEYAIQGMVYLAGEPPKNLVSQQEIAKALNVPSPFLGKIFQSLVKDGLIESVRGKHGGFRLAKQPENITLLEVVESIEGKSFLKSCLLGLPGCGDKNPCNAHYNWKKISDSILKLLRKNLLQFNRGFEEKIR